VVREITGEVMESSEATITECIVKKITGIDFDARGIV
jgi:hypothetical protein